MHPVARQAAHLDRVSDPLEGKFSIPYCVALGLRHGPPRLRDFASLDPEACETAMRVTVTVDASLPEFGAVLRHHGEERARVASPIGSPARPISPADLAGKLSDLAGDRLDGLLDRSMPPPPARCARLASASPSLSESADHRALTVTRIMGASFAVGSIGFALAPLNTYAERAGSHRERSPTSSARSCSRSAVWRSAHSPGPSGVVPVTAPGPGVRHGSSPSGPSCST